MYTYIMHIDITSDRRSVYARESMASDLCHLVTSGSSDTCCPLAVVPYDIAFKTMFFHNAHSLWNIEKMATVLEKKAQSKIN